MSSIHPIGSEMHQADAVRGYWTKSKVAAIAIGGALGASLRYSLLDLTGTGQQFPWPVVIVNVVGSFVLGMVMAEEWTYPRSRTLLHDGAGIGFCGGLTTFSTLALESAQYLDEGQVGMAVICVSVSVLTSMVAILVGAWSFRQVRALLQPLEGKP